MTKSVVPAAIKQLSLKNVLEENWSERKENLIKRILMNIVRDNPKLLECDPMSLICSAKEGLEWGLTPGKHFHLVPYGDKVKCMYDWKGLQKLCYRSKRLLCLSVQTVDEKDDFGINAGTGTVRHCININEQSGNIKFAYALAYLKDSPVPILEYMSKADIDKVKNCAKTKAVWDKWYNEMAKKTVLKRLIKHLPEEEAFTFMPEEVEREEINVTDSATDLKEKEPEVKEADKELETAFEEVEL